jgi:O-antigen ligase
VTMDGIFLVGGLALMNTVLGGVLLMRLAGAFPLLVVAVLFTTVCVEYHIVFRSVILPLVLAALFVTSRRFDVLSRQHLMELWPLFAFVAVLILGGLPLRGGEADNYFLRFTLMLLSGTGMALLWAGVDAPMRIRFLRWFLCIATIGLTIGVVAQPWLEGAHTATELVGHPTEEDFDSRVLIGFRHPNLLGRYTGVIILLAALTARASILSRPLALTTALLAASLLVLSGSRASLAALLFALVVVFMFLPRHEKTIAATAGLFAALGAIAIFMVVGSSEHHEALIGRFATLLQSPEAMYQGDIGRRIYWPAAVETFLKYPLFGAGTQNLPEAMRFSSTNGARFVFLSPETMFPAHNVYLQFLASNGIVGFATLTAFFLSFIRASVGLARSSLPTAKHWGLVGLGTLSITMFAGMADVTIGTQWIFNITVFGLYGAVRAEWASHRQSGES